MSGELVFVVDDDLSVRRSIRLVIITGHTEESTSDRARSLGVSQVVMKPFDEDGLLKAVSLAVPPRSVRRPLN